MGTNDDMKVPAWTGLGLICQSEFRRQNISLYADDTLLYTTGPSTCLQSVRRSGQVFGLLRQGASLQSSLPHTEVRDLRDDPVNNTP